MSKLQILDCTLRDGGYVNDFAFGKRAISKIIHQLTSAGIDVVECGFLEDGEYDDNCSVYNKVEQITPFIPKDRGQTIYVAMACYGEYDIAQLSDYDGSSIDGIRVSFHYNEFEEAMDFCQKIKDKGYKLFVQPVGTTSYTKEQLIKLIDAVNKIEPYSFYFVDTLGLMQESDVQDFFNFIDEHLNKNIHMGFHSHNNLQLSYSNCQYLCSINTDRTISLDSSVYGMGRGAGNLNTELITNYINNHSAERVYDIEPLLEIIDEFIAKIKSEFSWGYSVPFYLAAINGCHPNYAAYLTSKQTLNVKSIGKILRTIEPDKRSLFDKKLAEKKYLEFQSREIDDLSTITYLNQRFSNADVLVVAPGPSIAHFEEKIIDEASKCISIAVNFVPSFMECDYIFLGNSKRLHSTFNPKNKRVNIIHTSNLEMHNKSDSLIVNYSSLLSENDLVMDNTAIMLLNLITKFKPNRVYLAGLDGYSTDGKSNYYQERLQLYSSEKVSEDLNDAMAAEIARISKKLNISFITPSLYQK